MLLQGHLARPNPQVADLDCGGRGAGDLPGAARLYLAELVRSRPGRADLELRRRCTPTARRALFDDPDWLRAVAATGCRRGTRRARPRRGGCSDLPEAYLEAMLRGIVGIEIAVSRLEGKFKLSQNRPAADRPRIIAALERRDDQTSREVAGLMRERETAAEVRA